MNLYDARSYFGAKFETLLTDPAEVERQLAAHDDGETSPSVLEAIRVLADFVQFMARARKQSKAAKTLAGQTALEYMFTQPDHAGAYDKLWYQLWKTHRRTRRASQRVLEQLIEDGVLTCTYPRWYSTPETPILVAVTLK